MSSRNNSFAVYTASGRVLAMLCNFILPIFLTHFLTQEDYGVYSQFYFLLSFTGSLFSIGFQSNLYYYLPTASDSEKKTLISNTFITLLFLALLSFLCCIIPTISNFFIPSGSRLDDYIYIIAICVFFNIPSFILFPLFVILKDKKASVLFPVLEVITKALCVIVFALIFADLFYIFIGLLVLQLLLFVFTVCYAYYPLRDIKASFFNVQVLKQQLVYALPFGMSIIMATIFRQFDKMLCINYISSEEYAIYSLAFFGVPGINQIYDSVSEVNLLNMADAYKKHEENEVLGLYQSFCSKLLSFSLPVIFIIYVFTPQIFDFLFSPEYAASIPIFRIYIFSFVIGALGAGTVLRATGYTKYTFRAYLFSILFYLPFAYFSIRNYGTWGAISTAMLGLILPKSFQIYYEKCILNVPFKDYMPWKRFLKIVGINGLLLVPISALNFIFDINLIGAVVLSIAYVIVVYLFEIKYELFILEKSSLKGLMSRIHH